MRYEVDKLIAARIRRGLSQRALAEKIGISNQVISLVESGKNRSPRTLKKMAAYLRVPMSDLVLTADQMEA